MRAERALAGAGVLLLVAALALVVVWPGEALFGWLAAAVLFQALPMTALLLLAMMRLIPGAWAEMLGGTCRAVLPSLVPAALAFVPVLAGMAFLYPWVAAPAAEGFRSWWLTPLPFVLRTLIWFGGLGLLAWRCGARCGGATAVIATIFIALAGSLVFVDWLMSLTPDFSASGFGLQTLSLSVTAAFAILLLARLRVAPAPDRTGVLGALLLTLLLLWAYFQFLPWFIIWSGNLAGGADWYLPRGTGGWQYVLVAAGLLGGVPLLALLLPGCRGNGRVLAGLAVAVLAGKVLEFAWLAIPPHGGAAIVDFALAVPGFGALAAAALMRGRA